ncbi:leucine-rich repeat domain-containing protein [Ruminococcus albus]|uniref:Leucine rich repeat-containing protein n=1 Tax=Ruminococcus albus TaxID=1264 RepID=A0A1H7Q7J0_RUMAL|nr:leucine-rich repeat domain-containing protein [Ruminococcus albus]SEL43952.1 Leucine rich repeat-containing protein [Ruminococcus albus]
MGFVIKDGVLEKYIEEDGVTRAVVPEGVRDIHFKAFNHCENLTSIHLPKGLDPDWFDGFVLWDCDELTEITVDDDDPNFISEGGVLYSKDKTRLIRCPNGIVTERFVVPETVREISSDAFRCCYNIKEIIITGRLDHLGIGVFMDCTSLKHIEFGSQVCGFSDDLFLCCHKLEEIRIPDGVHSVGSNAFDHCYSLKKMMICQDLCEEDYSDLIAPNLEEYEVNLFNQTYSSKEGILYNNEFTILLRCPPGKSGDVVIPDTVREIAPAAFVFCDKLTSVYVPASVKRIAHGTFMNCYAKVTYEDRDSIEFYYP